MGFGVRVLGGIALVALLFCLAHGLRHHAICWLGLSVGVAAAILALWFSRWYRPPDNHVAVVYLLGRFGRLVGPDQLAWLWPLFERVRAEISLALRRQEVTLEQLPTQDTFPIDLHVAVRYQRDLRVAPAGFVVQALSLSEEAWDLLVHDAVQEAAREQLAGRSGWSLLDANEQAAFRARLSEAVEARLRLVGVSLDPKAGLTILDLRPSHTVWEALIDRVAAGPLGEAAHRRVEALLAEAERRNEEAARATVLLAGAAASVKGGTEAQLVVAPAIPVIGPSRPLPLRPNPPDRDADAGSSQPSGRAKLGGGAP